jgi:hypothetical protein
MIIPLTLLFGVIFSYFAQTAKIVIYIIGVFIYTALSVFLLSPIDSNNIFLSFILPIAIFSIAFGLFTFRIRPKIEASFHSIALRLLIYTLASLAFLFFFVSIIAIVSPWS